MWAGAASCSGFSKHQKLGSPLKDFVVQARKNLLPVRSPGILQGRQEFLPGVHAMAAPAAARPTLLAQRVHQINDVLAARPCPSA